MRSVALGDEELLRRLAEGDERALRDLFAAYGPYARALALRVVGSPTLADEVVQEAFLSIWQHARNYRRERGSVRAWLFATVHNRAVDCVRREEAYHRRAQDEETVVVLDAEDVAESVAELQELADRRREIREALQRLPAEQRAVLELMYFEGKTQAAIAAETGIPLGTVKSRTLLGMRRLRKDLEIEP